MRILRAIVIAALSLVVVHVAEATELRIRLVPPGSGNAPVKIRRAELFMGFWGGVDRLPLKIDADGQFTIVRVPLDDSSTYLAVGAQQAPEDSFIWIEAEGFAPTMSDRIRVPAMRGYPASVSFKGTEVTTISVDETKDMTLPLRETTSRSLRFVDDAGVPVAGLTMSVEAFWSRSNHCGVVQGAEPLLSEARSDANGIVVVPDGDVQYGVALRGAHLKLLDPPSWENDLHYFEASIPSAQQVVRVHQYRAQRGCPYKSSSVISPERKWR